MSTQMNEGFQLIHDLFRLRWIPEVIEAIALDHHKYSTISDYVEFISNTELNRKLALLQERGVILKTDEGYYLTEFGQDLNHIFRHFVEMSHKYISKTNSPTLL